MSLGTKIKELRKEKDLLQRELADILGCSEKAISSYERDYRRPDLQMLNKLSTYFNVPVDYLTKDTKKDVVEEKQTNYSIDTEDNLSDIHFLLNKYSSKFTKVQSNDLKELIKWYIDKNIK